MALALKFWGVRGSFPRPHLPAEIDEKIHRALSDFCESGHQDKEDIEGFLNSMDTHNKGSVGGNTTCVEIVTDRASIIIDAGTGLRCLGESLMTGDCGKGKGSVHIIITHFHWDHLMGLLSFLPLFTPGNRIYFYSVEPDLEKNIGTLFRKPFFPINIESLPATLVFCELAPRKPVKINGVDITPYKLDHPDPCWGLKIEHEGKTISYCVDTECTRMSSESLGLDLPLYQGIDLLVFDAQYTRDDANKNNNRGHSSSTIGLDLAFREGIKKVLFVHHDPFASDQGIEEVERKTRAYYNQILKEAQRAKLDRAEIEWQFVSESSFITV